MWCGRVCADGLVTLGKGDHEGTQHLQALILRGGPCCRDSPGGDVQGAAGGTAGRAVPVVVLGSVPAFVGPGFSLIPLPGIKAETAEEFAQR